VVLRGRSFPLPSRYFDVKIVKNILRQNSQNILTSSGIDPSIVKFGNGFTYWGLSAE
jgi:hypothetical protein